MTSDTPEELNSREFIARAITDLNSAQREAFVLKRIGTAFNSHQTIQAGSLHAAHAIKSALGLEAVRVWTYERHRLILAATTQGRDRNALAPTDISNLASWAIWDNHQRALLPLHVMDSCLGYLELIAPACQEQFVLERNLHITIAEQLALVVRSAQMFESLEQMATTDPLTGLANHRSLQDFLAEQCDLVRTRRVNLGVVMVDVDHFRRFNEDFGHDAGDYVLKSVAQALHRAVGERGMAARYGGEEFTLVLPQADEQLTEILALNALDHIRHVTYRPESGEPRTITASLGFAFAPDWGDYPQQLLKVADNALYAAKHAGRNQVKGPSADPLDRQAS